MDKNDVVAILLVAIGLWAALSLYIVHRNKESKLDLCDLIMHGDKVDLTKFCQIVALIVSSWVVYFMTLNHKLTEWAFGLYMGAWVGARAISLIAALRGQQQEQQK